jgi:hypothetical protein
MTSITTRETAGGGATVKDAPLTNAEIDNNFISITTSKLEASNNLSDLTDTSAAKANLDLATMAEQESNNVSITGGSITGITDLGVSDGGTGASTTSGARTNLGLGSIATQDSNNVSITGGSITGITDLDVSDGGTGASTASGARTNLGLEIGSDIQSQIQIDNETSSSVTVFPVFVNGTSGNLQDTVSVSSSKLFYQPSSGTLNATVFNSLSDISVKKDINEIKNALEIVDLINGVNFNWKDTDSKSSGVIAQEIEKVIPHLVSTTHQGFKTVNYAGLTAYLISAIKELSDKIK